MNTSIKKKMLFLMFLVLIFMQSVTMAGYQEMNNLEYEVQINSDGSMNVKEIWDVYISDTDVLVKNFPENDSKYSEITDINVREITDTIIKEFQRINGKQNYVAEGFCYGDENEDGKFEIGWSVGLDNTSATKIYEIEYKVVDVITKALDYSELYWPFITYDNNIFIKHLNGIIKLPFDGMIEHEQIKVWGHSESTNAKIGLTENGRVGFYSDDFSGETLLRVRILFPSDVMAENVKKVVNENILEKVISEENALKEMVVNNRNNIVDIIISIILLCSLIITLKGIKKSLQILKTQTKSKPTQKLKYFEDIPRENVTPAEAAFLVDGNYYGINISNDVFANVFLAIILQLNLKGYIKIEVDDTKTKREQIIIKVLRKDIDDFDKEEEKIIYNYLLEMQKTEEIINSRTIRKYMVGNIDKFVDLNNEICSSLMEVLDSEKLIHKENKEMYYGRVFLIPIKALKNLPWIFLLIMLGKEIFNFKNMYLLAMIGLSLFWITFILSVFECILDIMVLNRINVLTDKGLDEKEKWQGFKKYLKDFSLLNEKPSIELWNKYLIYTTAFGINKKVIKQIKNVYPEFESSNTINDFEITNLLMSSNFNDTFAKSINSSINSIMSYGDG